MIYTTLLLKIINKTICPLLILFLVTSVNSDAAEATMQFNGTSTSFNGITVSFSTGAFTNQTGGSAMSVYASHPYATPINGGDDYKDITISPATYIAKVTIAWGVNVQGFKLQFRHNNTVVKEITDLNAVANITVPTDFTVNQVVDVIRFLDAGVSNSGGFELSHITFNQALPVELTSFTAIAVKNSTLLNWQTATEVNNYGFSVERRVKNEEWKEIGFVNGYGNSDSPKEYSFTDGLALNHNLTLLYRLKQIDNDGTFTYSDAVAVTCNLQPSTFGLFQNYPNPFNPSTMITYQLPANSKVSLKIFNTLGKEIETLVDEYQEAGFHSTLFTINSKLSSGFYFYQLKTGSFFQTRKMLLLK